MASRYFSDRQRGERARSDEGMPVQLWAGIAGLIQSLATRGAFGIDFPQQCDDGNAVIGTDWHQMRLAVQGEIPGLAWPLDVNVVPEVLLALDMIEFCYDHVAEPSEGSYHSFYKHYHLSFDRPAGQQAFQESVNRLLARNGSAYELSADGLIDRVGSPIDPDTVLAISLDTGDDGLNQLIGSAIAKYRSPDATVRMDALEKLWDAWERLKTLDGPDKKASTKMLLDGISTEHQTRAMLETEARALTDMGNTFHIRHAETNQVEITDPHIADYFFHRLFSMIQLAVRSRARG